MLCRIALWDCFLFLLLAVFRLSGRLGRCCVELLYGTVFFFCYWLFSGYVVDWVDVVSNCSMGLFSFFFLLAVFRLSGRLGRGCVELLYGTVFFFCYWLFSG